MLIFCPVLINPEEQKLEDRVNTPPCLNHLEEQKSANPEELKSEDHVNTPPCVNQPARAEIRRSC